MPNDAMDVDQSKTKSWLDDQPLMAGHEPEMPVTGKDFEPPYALEQLPGADSLEDSKAELTEQTSAVESDKEDDFDVKKGVSKCVNILISGLVYTFGSPILAEYFPQLETVCKWARIFGIASLILGGVCLVLVLLYALGCKYSDNEAD